MRIRVKICGITNVEDAAMAGRLGADAVGINCYPASARHVSFEQASRIVDAVHPFVSVVALFVDPEPEQVLEVIEHCRIDCLQFHGSEPAEVCRRFARPYIKAARVDEGFSFEAFRRDYDDAAGYLLDAAVPGRHGGTGETFDWSRWPCGHGNDYGHDRLILAGGLTPDNVGEAIRATGAMAVDVASGVEAGDKRRKDPELVRRFIEQAQAAAS